MSFPRSSSCAIRSSMLASGLWRICTLTRWQMAVLAMPLFLLATALGSAADFRTAGVRAFHPTLHLLANGPAVMGAAAGRPQAAQGSDNERDANLFAPCPSRPRAVPHRPHPWSGKLAATNAGAALPRPTLLPTALGEHPDPESPMAPPRDPWIPTATSDESNSPRDGPVATDRRPAGGRPDHSRA